MEALLLEIKLGSFKENAKNLKALSQINQLPGRLQPVPVRVPAGGCIWGAFELSPHTPKQSRSASSSGQALLARVRVLLVTSRSIFTAPGPAAGLCPKSLTSPVSPSVTRQRVLPARLARGRPPRARPCCCGFKKHTLVWFFFI